MTFFRCHIKTFLFFGCHIKTFSWRLYQKKVFMIFVRKFVGKSRTKTFRANLGEIGQKSFPTPKICLLLHIWSKVQNIIENRTPQRILQCNICPWMYYVNGCTTGKYPIYVSCNNCSRPATRTG